MMFDNVGTEQDWRQQLEEERLSLTLEVLQEIYKAGFYEHAEFLASELGVKSWWKQPQLGT
jgi:hypothetical protein